MTDHPATTETPPPAEPGVMIGPVVLVLEALPDDVPGLVRLRRYLKLALRGYGLRCTHVGYKLPTGHVCNADPPDVSCRQENRTDL